MKEKSKKMKKAEKNSGLKKIGILLLLLALVGLYVILPIYTSFIK